MQTQTISKDGIVQLEISGIADVSSATQLHQLVCELIGNTDRLICDATNLDAIDVACAQILLAAQQGCPGFSLTLKPDSSVAKWLEETGLPLKYSVATLAANS